VAPWPTDPSEASKLNEMMFAGLDELMKKGEMVDFGMFVDGTAGFGISTGEAADVFRRVNMFQPYFLAEVHEIVPYEQGKEILRGIMKARIEQPK
jgi:hypothetical protein